MSSLSSGKKTPKNYQAVFIKSQLTSDHHFVIQVTQTSLKIGDEEVKCQKMADLAMADLAEAMPALEEARKALEFLNKNVSLSFDIKSIF